MSRFVSCVITVLTAIALGVVARFGGGGVGGVGGGGNCLKIPCVGARTGALFSKMFPSSAIALALPIFVKVKSSLNVGINLCKSLCLCWRFGLTLVWLAYDTKDIYEID
jgi:hypothetical protein